MKEMKEKFEDIISKAHPRVKNVRDYNLILRMLKEAYSLDRDEWIPVEERLPESGEDIDFTINVLCLRDNGLQYVYSFIKHEDNKGRFYLSIGTIFHEVTDEVTHWQPLPKAPLTTP